MVIDKSHAFGPNLALLGADWHLYGGAYSMVWLTAQDDDSMLMVRHTAEGYQLLRVSRRGAEVLETFARCEDAIARWNDLENIERKLDPAE